MGFEPTLPFRVNTLSKRAPSATRPSLRQLVGEAEESDDALAYRDLSLILWVRGVDRKQVLPGAPPSPTQVAAIVQRSKFQRKSDAEFKLSNLDVLVMARPDSWSGSSISSAFTLCSRQHSACCNQPVESLKLALARRTQQTPDPALHQFCHSCVPWARTRARALASIECDRFLGASVYAMHGAASGLQEGCQESLTQA